MSSIQYLIIDWGTTNFRAFAMTKDHELVNTVERPMGLLQVQDGDFAAALQGVLAQWLVDYERLPIYMAGMVGSAKGWHQVDYVATQASQSDLQTKAFSFELPWGAKAIIFPGVSHQHEEGIYDVMRGEEIQIFGLVKKLGERQCTLVLPGTHSKHAEVADGQIVSFSSFMTGEMFSVLARHTLLGKGLPPNKSLNKPVFEKGVKEGAKGKLTNRAFMTWTHRLFNNLDDSQALDYLSGCLIGYELSALSSKRIYLIGGASLCQRYQQAASYLGIHAEVVSGNDCFLAGMTDLVEDIK